MDSFLKIWDKPFKNQNRVLAEFPVSGKIVDTLKKKKKKSKKK